MSLSCLNITNEKVRATVKFGGLEIKTPYVKAFNTTRTRPKPSASYSLTVEVRMGVSFTMGADLEIFAGLKDDEKHRFTGIIVTVNSQPNYDKAGYYTLQISGYDRMGLLENKTFSRRLRSDGFSMFASIDGGPSNRPTRGFSIDKRIVNGKHQYTSSSPRPDKIQNSEITYMPNRGDSKKGSLGKASRLEYGNMDIGAGMKPHKHDSQSEMGPAFGVYSAD